MGGKKDFVFSNQENQVNPGSDNKSLLQQLFV
jgi:hypothetical protein